MLLGWNDSYQSETVLLEFTSCEAVWSLSVRGQERKLYKVAETLRRGDLHRTTTVRRFYQDDDRSMVLKETPLAQTDGSYTTTTEVCILDTLQTNVQDSIPIAWPQRHWVDSVRGKQCTADILPEFDIVYGADGFVNQAFSGKRQVQTLLGT